MGTLYRNGVPYIGGGSGSEEASQIHYDNTESGIPSTSVQGAIDELKIEIGDTDISSIGDGTLSGAVSELNNGLMHAETKTISVNNEGKTVIFNDISKIPVLIANQTSGQYPIFLPYLHGGAVRARVIDFSSNSWLLVQNVTLTVIVYYINNPQ